MKLLKEQLIPWIKRLFKETGIILQQDGATSPTANVVQDWCKDNMAGFWGKHLWPPSSPDLNTMDFAIWTILESNLCSSSHQSVTSLKAKLHCWNKISPETTRASCTQVSERLRRVVKAKEGYIKR